MPSIADILQSGSLAYQQPSPSSVAARRAIAQQLMQAQVQNAGPLGALANTVGGFGSGWLSKSAGDQEAQGQADASAALAEALKGGGSMESLSGALGNQFMNSGQQGLISALLGREIEQSDPSYQLDMDLKRAQLEAAQAKPVQQPVNFDDISGLRKEVQGLPSYKNLAQAAPIYQSMFETAGRNTRASDLNLVYGLGKIMDPTSVVREGEMVMVRNTASLPDWLVGTINSLNGGAGLTPETREAILQEAFGRVKGYQNAFDQDMSMYKGVTDRYGINQADVIPSFPQAQAWERSNQPVVIDGVTIRQLD